MSNDSVWVVTWHHMNDQSSGIRGVFASKESADRVAIGMTRDTLGSVYTASQWVVIPNSEMSSVSKSPTEWSD